MGFFRRRYYTGAWRQHRPPAWKECWDYGRAGDSWASVIYWGWTLKYRAEVYAWWGCLDHFHIELKEIK